MLKHDASFEEQANYWLARLPKLLKRGGITAGEYAEQMHIYSCPRQREIQKALTEPTGEVWLERGTEGATECPGCGVRIERKSCFSWGETTDTEVWCLRDTFCCPRCGAEILRVITIEYERGCSICGNPVGPGKHRRMSSDVGNPSVWQCELCFEKQAREYRQRLAEDGDRQS